MSGPNFNSVLDQTFTEELTRPPAAPTGYAFLQATGMPKMKEVKAQGEDKDIIEISLKPMSYKSTDDPSQSAYNLSEMKPFQYSVWFSRPPTEKERFDWQQLCKNVFGIDVKGKNIKQHCAEIPGKQCLGKIGQKPTQDRVTGEMFMENTLGSLAPV